MSGLEHIFGEDFDTSSYEPADDFAPLPPGKYVATVEKAEVKQTRAGDGHYLAVQMVIMDGDYRNRKLWANLNIDNPSSKAEEIGRRQLSALARAAGLSKLSDEDQLLGATVVASVKISKDRQGNEVRTFAPVGDAAAAQHKNPPIQHSEQDGTKPECPAAESTTAPRGRLPWEDVPGEHSPEIPF